MALKYEIFRRAMAKIIPGQTFLTGADTVAQGVREKGRKANYHQFHLGDGEFKKHERLLNTEEVSSFLEISIRASACPMPFNLDIYDGLLCPFGCKYCHPSGTKIKMADGTEKRVERIREGDLVLTYNEKTGQAEEGVVTDPQHRHAPYLIEIEAGGKKLQLTPEHPILTKRGWVDAGELLFDDEVLVW